MPDRKKVISHFQDALQASGDNNKWRFVRADIIEDAIALLEAQEPRVMTLEEIEDALDNVVWLDIPGAENLADGFSLIMAYSRKNGFVLLDSPFGDNPSQDRFEYTDYNKTWRCWTYRPTAEQREAVKWDG